MVVQIQVAPAQVSSESSATAKQQKRRVCAWRGRRRRTHMLPARMGLTCGLLAMMAGLASLGYLTHPKDAEAAERRELAAAAEYTVADQQLLALDEEGAATSYGSHHGRHLSVVSPCPASYGNCPSTGSVTCPADISVANSTYPPLPFKIPEQQGAAVAVQLIVMLYMFLGLAIVCDSFFEASLDAICQSMGLKDDVAGATWMAAGGSAPELATSVLGVFVSFSDVGFGTIVGSAVFNVLFVIACCAFAQPNLKLTWWPLARDASFYCLSLAMIVIFVSDDLLIAVWEAAVLLLMYTVYVTIMAYNESLEAKVTRWVKKDEDVNQQSGTRKSLIKMFDGVPFATTLYVVIAVNSAIVIWEMVDDNARAAESLWCVCGENYGTLGLSAFFWVNLGFNVFFILEMLVKFYAYGVFGYWKQPLNCFDGSLVFLIVVEFILTFGSGADSIAIGSFRILRILKFIRFARMLRLLRCLRFFVAPKDSTPESAKVGPELVGHKARTDEEGKSSEKAEAAEGKEAEEEDDDDDDDDGPFNPFEVPEGPIGKFFWVVGLPLSVLMWLTIPDCRREFIGQKGWPLTFTMCIVWIATLSFFMVWMVTEFGKVFNVRDSIMGITLLAAGTSIPDCLSSIAVARRGHGDMAVSSSIGSNIFDVLIGLPVPWLIYDAILRPVNEAWQDRPQWQPIQSESLAVMILSLFVMVALVITTIHLSGWVLSVRLGIGMMVLYFLFLCLSLLLEFEVWFGPCKNGPPACSLRIPIPSTCNVALGSTIG